MRRRPEPHAGGPHLVRAARDGPSSPCMLFFPFLLSSVGARCCSLWARLSPARPM